MGQVFGNPRALEDAVENGNWTRVGKLLEHGVPAAKKNWAVAQAIQRADDWELVNHILPCCTHNQLDSALTVVVERGLWSFYSEILKRGVTGPNSNWALTEAVKRADYIKVAYCILPYCTGDKLNSTFTVFVERGLWRCVNELLKRGVTAAKCRWAVGEGVKRADDWDLSDYLLPYCTDDQLDSALTVVVERGLWRSVGKLLKRGVTAGTCTWAVSEAVKRADDHVLAQYIVRYCTDDQLHSALTVAVERGRWTCVSKLLKRGVTVSQRESAVSEAVKRADDRELAQNILPYCTDEQLDWALTVVTERGLWRCVSELLDRGVTAAKCKWAVEEALKRADDWELADILPYCTEHQLDSAFTVVVERGLWGCVEKLLKRGLSQTQYIWAAEEACKCADDTHLRNILLLRMYGGELPESVFNSVVLNGRWHVLRTLIRFGLCKTQWKRTVKEVLKNADNASCTGIVKAVFRQEKDLLHFCDEQSVQNDRLTHLYRQHTAL